MDKKIIAGLVFWLFLAQGVSATPILGCLTDAQEQALADIATNSSVSSDQFKSIFLILCESKAKSDNVYTKNETDQKMNFTETILAMQLEDIESINQSLKAEIDTKIENLSRSLQEDMDILRAIETMTTVVNTSVNQEAWQNEIKSVKDRVDGYQSILDDTRSQLNTLLIQGVQAQNSTTQYVPPAQQRPVDYTVAIIMIALIFGGLFGWYTYATRFYKRDRKPVTENVSMSDDEFDEALERTDIIGDSRAKSARAHSSREAKLGNIKKTVQSIKDETSEFEKKRK